VTTSKSKALRNAIRGKPSKASASRTTTRRQTVLDAPIRSVSRRKLALPRTEEQASATKPYRRKTDLARSSRVTASRTEMKRPSRSSPGAALLRKRQNSKTVNLRGRYSQPDLKSVDDRGTRARATGRRNKAVATVAALRRSS
jgi:hypothetical protein